MVLTASVAYITVCAAPGCQSDAEPLALLRRTLDLPLIVLPTNTSISRRYDSRHIAKAKMVCEYLLSAEGRAWQHVVYADALDVIPASASASAVESSIARLVGGRDGAVDGLIASAEPACWVGLPCTSEDLASMRRTLPQHFAATAHALFPCAGQLAGTRSAILRFFEYILRAANGVAWAEAPKPLLDFWRRHGRRRLDDQGLLMTYWLGYPGRVTLDTGHTLFGHLSNWYILQRELGFDGRTPFRRASVPACSRLYGTVKSFAEGRGYFCDDAFNTLAFEPAACPQSSVAARSGGGDGVRTAKWCGQRLAGSSHIAASNTASLNTSHTASGAEQPLLGWHGSGHAGKVLLRTLWEGMRERSSTETTAVGVVGKRRTVGAMTLRRPAKGVCAVTEPGEGDCSVGWMGSWHASEHGVTNLEGCAALCTRCARCRFVSFSRRADDCSWFARCPQPLLMDGAAGQFRTAAIGTMENEAAPLRKAEAACAQPMCTRVARLAACSFASGDSEVSTCTPHRLWQHARTPDELSLWSIECAGCNFNVTPISDSVKLTAKSALMFDASASETCGGHPPLAGARVFLWSLISVAQHGLLAHFLTHYAAIGIPLASRATFVLHAPSAAFTDLATTRALLATSGVATENTLIIANYSTVLKKDLVNAFLLTLPADSWLVHADVDEFFVYPCDVFAVLAAKQLPAACATMVDRLGTGAPLPTLHATPRLEEQFPACARVRGGAISGSACLLKLTLLATRVGGITPRFESSHRASLDANSESSTGRPRLRMIGGCTGQPLACEHTGGFSHVQFFAQSVAMQAEKVRVHEWASDVKNAETYTQYLGLLERDASRAPISTFTPLALDAISQSRVSCRWTCPTCEAMGVHSTRSIAKTSAASRLPSRRRNVTRSRRPRPAPLKAAQLALANETLRIGTCEQTEFGGDCTSGTLGAWQAPSLAACVQRCKGCVRCRYISFSAKHADCSWFAECNLGALHTFEAHPELRGWSYRTVQVKQTELPPPHVDPCATMQYEPPPASSVASRLTYEAASSLAARLTVFVSASPRPSDSEAAPAAPLMRAIASVRGVLGLNSSRVVVVVDGIRGRPSASASMQSALDRKVVHARRRIVSDPLGIDLVTFGTWLHQANALRCALHVVPRTPLIFSIQEDTTIAPPVDVRLITERLMSDPSVEYVKFSQHNDCADEQGSVRDAYAPCTPHPETPLLHRIGFWHDRPHFATRRAYDEHVFPLVQPTARVAPEQVFIHRVPRATGLWAYGRREHMLHDLHAGAGKSSYDVYAYHKASYRNGRNVEGDAGPLDSDPQPSTTRSVLDREEFLACFGPGSCYPLAEAARRLELAGGNLSALLPQPHDPSLVGCEREGDMNERNRCDAHDMSRVATHPRETWNLSIATGRLDQLVHSALEYRQVAGGASSRGNGWVPPLHPEPSQSLDVQRGWRHRYSLRKFGCSQARGEDAVTIRSFFTHWKTGRALGHAGSAHSVARSVAHSLPTFLEIGALDGFSQSNTWVFERCLGWRGVLVEGEPSSFERLRENRPRTLNLRLAACGDQPMHSVASMASDQAPSRARLVSVGSAGGNAPATAGARLVRVECGPVAAYLTQLSITRLDFVSIDVEGSELAVVESLLGGHISVGVVIVECRGDGLRRPITSMLLAHGLLYVGQLLARGSASNMIVDDCFVNASHMRLYFPESRAAHELPRRKRQEEMISTRF